MPRGSRNHSGWDSKPDGAGSAIYTGPGADSTDRFPGSLTRPDLVSVLKEEIRRLARKEIRAQVGKTKQAVAQYRREIAELKRTVNSLEKKLAFLESRERERLAQPAEATELPEGARFSSRSVRSQRRRLGLTREDFALLVGVSPQTIYNWETDKARPQEPQMASLVAVRQLGKRQAAAQLEAIKGQGGNG